MFLRPVPVRVHFALLLHVWLVFSLSRKTTSLLEQRTSRFLPNLLGCCCLERSAPLPGSVSRDLLPSPLLRNLMNLFLQASGSPVHPGPFSVHKHVWSLPGTWFACLTLTNSKRRTQHPVHGTTVKQCYNFHQNSKNWPQRDSPNRWGKKSG